MNLNKLLYPEQLMYRPLLVMAIQFEILYEHATVHNIENTIDMHYNKENFCEIRVTVHK